MPGVDGFLHLAADFRAERFIALVFGTLVRELCLAVEFRVFALLAGLVLLHQDAQGILVIDRGHAIVVLLVVLLLYGRYLPRIFRAANMAAERLVRDLTFVAANLPISGVR